MWYGGETRVIPEEQFGDDLEFYKPFNRAFDVSEEVMKFICSKGAECGQCPAL